MSTQPTRAERKQARDLLREPVDDRGVRCPVRRCRAGPGRPCRDGPVGYVLPRREVHPERRHEGVVERVALALRAAAQPSGMLASKAVAAIVLDLTDRRGLRHEWERIDADVRHEIFEAWKACVATAGGA